MHDSQPRAVILDVFGLEILDSEEFAELRRLIMMVTIMGTESLLVGLQPGVVSALIEMQADVGGLRTAIDLDAAFELLEPEPEPPAVSEAEASGALFDPGDGRSLDTSERALENER